LASLVADITGLRRSRDLSAWLGLTPKPHSSGGKERPGRISGTGNRYLRRLLYLGAMGVITAHQRGAAGDDWLGKLLQRKTAKQAAIALANRIARTVWAMLRNGADYGDSRAA
jgi:transposase